MLKGDPGPEEKVLYLRPRETPPQPPCPSPHSKPRATIGNDIYFYVKI